MTGRSLQCVALPPPDAPLSSHLLPPTLSPMDDPTVVLDVQDLTATFSRPRGDVVAVDGLSLRVHRGEMLAVVGESGSGKSVTALSLMRLLTAGRATGRVLLRPDEGPPLELLGLSERQMQGVRGRHLSMVFQEPMSSLNPLQRVGDQIAEVMHVHGLARGRQALFRTLALLHQVGMPDPEVRMKHYPHQLSGGMRQRVMIALALAGNPSLLIADEPTTALDVSIQAQILRLLGQLKRQFGMGILFITHDMGVVAQMADRVVVMHGGQVVETAPVTELFARPRHPYTQGLLAAMPRAGVHGRLPGIATPNETVRREPDACGHAPRCARAQARCLIERPDLTGPAPHAVRCFFPLVPA
jgi:oligopeptide/dipeptide ABC transporter ATP-binding protein